MFTGNNPGDVPVVEIRVGIAVGSLEGASGEEPCCHEEATNQESGAATELVEIENGGQCHDHVDDVLDTSCKELIGDSSSTHDEDLESY